MAVNMENLPENLLLDILSLVPASDLICNCRLVCSQWRDLVDLPVLWKRKYQKKDTDSSPKPLAYYIFSHLAKNLIKNPDGEDGLDSWEIQAPAEGHWETEEMSAEDLGMNPHDIKDPSVQPYKCFVARNGPCSKSQLITLKDEGYWDELMDEARPMIMVEDIFSIGPRSHYKLTVKLLSADSEVLQEHQYEKVGVASRFQVLHNFDNYPQGVRHILFEHKAHKEPYRNLLKFLFPDQGPSEDREPPWGGMRVWQSTITLYLDDYINPPKLSSSDLQSYPWTLFCAPGFEWDEDDWHNDNVPPSWPNDDHPSS